MTSLKHIWIFLLLPFMSIGQVSETSELFLALKKLDAQLFEEGFNNCNKEAMEAVLSEDLEFFHDQNGITKGKELFITSFMTNMCDKNRKPIRKLAPGSLSVFPLYNNGTLYGAIQKGTHEFYIKESGKELYATSISEFTHLWLKEDTGWKISRVLSYDHKAPEIKNHGIKVATELLAQYTGNYNAPQTGNIIISVKDQIIHLDAGKMQADLVAKSNTVFAHPQAPIELKFIARADGSIEKFIVLEHGKIVEEAMRVD